MYRFKAWFTTPLPPLKLDGLDLYVCKYCHKDCKNKGGFTEHTKHCKLKPTKYDPNKKRKLSNKKSLKIDNNTTNTDEDDCKDIILHHKTPKESKKSNYNSKHNNTCYNDNNNNKTENIIKKKKRDRVTIDVKWEIVLKTTKLFIENDLIKLDNPEEKKKILISPGIEFEYNNQVYIVSKYNEKDNSILSHSTNDEKTKIYMDLNANTLNSITVVPNALRGGKLNKNKIYNAVAMEFGTKRCNVIKWFNCERDKIRQQIEQISKTAAKLGRKLGEKRGAKFPVEEEQLMVLFDKFRKKGIKISELWFKLRFKKILQTNKPEGYDSFKFSNGWFAGFKERHRLVIRRANNKKTKTLKERESLFTQFHQHCHEVRNTKQYLHQSDVYGKFSGENIYHFDEVPCPFVFNTKTTYERMGKNFVAIKQPGNGLDKRQYTACLTFRATGEQHVGPSVIFRGHGIRINKSETAQYPDEINWWYQENAWMDNDGMIKQLRHHKKCRENDNCKEWCWYISDNLEAHIHKRIKKYGTRYVKAQLSFTPPDTTDAISVVDRLAYLFKKYLGDEYSDWCWNNLEEWEERKTSASQRRILFMHWVSKAWDKLKSKHDLIEKMFVQCGIYLKKDGSNYNDIKIPGFDEYEFKPALTT